MNKFGWTVCALMACGVASAAEIGRIDFGKTAGKVRPELHASGLGPKLTGRNGAHNQVLRELNLSATRTHDWALFNEGQRICDMHFIFPLMHLDAKDPKNYYFGPTDEILRRSREAGLKILFRLGSSIEHTGDIHWNTRIPDDFDKVAEVFAGTIRHYNKGWADGHEWGIKYWEIWNEPDGIDASWCWPGKRCGNAADEREMFERFAVLMAKCIRRIKSEFPDVKVGGPALCGWWGPYFKVLLDACRKEGAMPDFISWHSYDNNPFRLIASPGVARKWCVEYGVPDMELILDEWHYFPDPAYWRYLSGTREEREKVYGGPAGLNNIDSAVFTLMVLAGFQSTPLDQAYFYGCGYGNWGVTDAYGERNKNYYALKAFGSFVGDCPTFAPTEQIEGYRLFGGRRGTGLSARLLVCDWRGKERELAVRVDGLENIRSITARVLDNEGDLVEVPTKWSDGVLTLTKRDDYSAAFVIDFLFGPEQASVDAQPAPANVRHISGEKVFLPRYDEKRSQWERGYHPEGIRMWEVSASHALVSNSMTVVAADGRTLRADVDYKVEPRFGCVGLVGAAAEDASVNPVTLEYDCFLERLDSLCEDAAGRKFIVRGEETVFNPREPEIPAGCKRLGNWWVRGPGRLDDGRFFPCEGDYVPPPVVVPAEKAFPKTLAKLRAGEPVTILAWGDSVTECTYLQAGERWQRRVVAALKAKFPKSDIRLVELGWGGHNMPHFLGAPEGSPFNYREKVLGSGADLVISEFVNDGCLFTNKVDVMETYAGVLKDFRERNMEWVAFTPHYIAPDWMGLESAADCDADPRVYVTALREFAVENGIGLAEASPRWGHLWREGVPYPLLFVNGVNHPDARGLGFYVDAFLSLLSEK